MSAVVTKLRVLYDEIGELSTATQTGRCSDFVRTFEGKDAPLLISWFAESLNEIQSRYGRINQPFLDPVATRTRKALGPDSIGTNRVVHLLKEAGEIRVSSESLGGAYRFRYIEREIPTLRAAGVGRPESGRGGIDYVALRTSGKREQPCLGEIKVGADQNAFYAFIQLLTYLTDGVFS